MPLNFSPRVSLLVGALCIAFSPIFTKMTGIPGLSSAFYRVAIAFLIFLPFAIYNRYYIIDLDKLGLSLVCGLFFAMDLGCWNQSLMITNTAIATVLGNLAPVWAGILLYIFTSHKPTLFYWAGVILALVGLIIMIGWDTVRHLSFDHGSVLALIGSFFYACYMVVTGKAREGTSTMTFMFYSMLGYLLSSFIIALVFHAPLSHFSLYSWGILLLLAIVPQLLGWICVNHALGTLPSTEVSMVLLSQIVIASLLATIIFKEMLSTNQIMGGIVIIIGIAITYIRKFSPHT
ncbi:MAG: DMT family transporter [Saprospiraceae bacterium]